MRFEAKHSYFKRVNQATHNHINLTYSLALRHQRHQLYHLSSKNYFSTIEYGNLRKINPDFLDFVRMITADDEVVVYSSIEINSICYKIDDMIVKSVVDSFPIFAQIKSIAKTKECKTLFIIQCFKTVQFCQFKMGYILENVESVYTSIESNLTLYPFPLDLYNNNDSADQKIVVPKYPLI
ncbi:unnamed protein product [Brachionus calyciflorus]|uniref:Uncharacterized protein n=1 Tax=Brachionus calyciflorus TaxID=104777 RepID=A0A813XWS1_9BILA|nr:unnamed protein product [Brachionus calyciflorus]